MDHDIERFKGDLYVAGPSTPPIVIVVAVARNGAIGRAGTLPWTMPGDLARFRELTIGTPMIMGRRTFESIGRVLPGRESIVVTHRHGLPDGVHRVGDLDAATVLARERAAAMGAGAISLIGGATLFKSMMPQVSRVHMTIVDLEPAADTFFPGLDPATWREVTRKTPPRHPGDEAACDFVDYVRDAATHLV